MISFYRNILGNAADQLPAVNPEIMKRGNGLTRQQQLQLVAQVTHDEVYQALMSIDDHKAPGCDVIYEAINCTTIILIPKIKNPTKI